MKMKKSEIEKRFLGKEVKGLVDSDIDSYWTTGILSKIQESGHSFVVNGFFCDKIRVPKNMIN